MPASHGRRLDSIGSRGCCLRPEFRGQATPRTISGRVSDPSGASVSGVIVTITEISKGVTFTATTNDDMCGYSLAHFPESRGRS
jgi:hypothetical protein